MYHSLNLFISIVLLAINCYGMRVAVLSGGHEMRRVVHEGVSGLMHSLSHALAHFILTFVCSHSAFPVKNAIPVPLRNS